LRLQGGLLGLLIAIKEDVHALIPQDRQNGVVYVIEINAVGYQLAVKR
jgi:hypothetical protein